MNYYVRPSSDVFVKYLFGREQNKDLLIDFIRRAKIPLDSYVVSELKSFGGYQ